MYHVGLSVEDKLQHRDWMTNASMFISLALNEGKVKQLNDSAEELGPAVGYICAISSCVLHAWQAATVCH